MTTHAEPGDNRLDPSLSAIMSERRQLINLGYRLLGSLADAEDVVQRDVRPLGTRCPESSRKRSNLPAPGS